MYYMRCNAWLVVALERMSGSWFCSYGGSSGRIDRAKFQFERAVELAWIAPAANAGLVRFGDGVA